MALTTSQFDKICRSCLHEATNMNSLFTKLNDDNRNINEVLTFVTNLDIKLDDGLPKYICNECETIMCKAEVFIKRCLDSDVLLKKVVRSSTKDEQKCFMDDDLYKNSFAKLTDEPFESPINLFDNDFEVKHAVLGDLNKDQDMKVETSATEQNENCNMIKTESAEEQDNYTYDDNISPEIPIDFSEENSTKSYKCSCGSSFANKEKYNVHSKIFNCKKTTKGKKPKAILIMNQISCHFCSRKFKTVSAWGHHQRMHKDREKTKEMLQCSLCLKNFKHKSTLALHLQKHEDSGTAKYICDKCKREFKYKSYLENHMISAHSKNGFACDFCTLSFSKKEQLEVHRDEHKIDKKHQCGICKKAFYMACTLRDHMRVHTGEKPFLCSICGKGFTQKNNMIQHVRRHQGLKPFKCENCEKRFVSKGELDAHSRKHSGAHPFVCDECGNGFTTSSSLVKHRRIHTGERPYACDLCPQKFAASGTLKNHRRRHTGERPYHCSYCEKAFVQRNDLISHIRCHTGERPFICAQCGQSFRKPSALKAHTRMHTHISNDLMLPAHCQNAQ